MNKISVCMPTWNRAKQIPNAIRSIIDQTYKDWELVIIDDGSTDETGRIVKDFAHPKIKYYKIEHQNNISRVRNIAVEKATGDIIVVQDSDDLSLPDRLEEIADVFAYNETDVVYHGTYITGYDPYSGALTRMVRPAKAYEKKHLLSEQYIPGQIAFRKEIGVAYNEEITLCDDYMFLLELALNEKRFTPIYKNLYEYMISSDSINVNGEIDGRRKKDVEKMLEILNKKYHYDAHAILTKTVDGYQVQRQII